MVLTGQSAPGAISIENTPPKGIDWSEGETKLRPLPVSALQIDKPVIKAGETETLTLTVENLGKGINYQLKARVISKDKRFNNQLFWFGKILPDKKKSYTLKVPIDTSAHDRIVPIKIGFSEFNKNIPGLIESQVIVRSLPKPEFAYAFQIFDNTNRTYNTVGNSDGLIQKGETVNLQLKIKNTGAYDAKNVLASINLDKVTGLSIGKTEFQIGKLSAGMGKNVSFIISVKEDTNIDSIRTRITIADTFFNVYMKDSIFLPVYKKPVGRFEPLEKEVITSREADIFAGADMKSPVIATTKRPILLEVTGQIEEFYRLRVPVSDTDGATITGWILAEQCKDSRIVNQAILKQLSKPAVFKYYKKNPEIELISPVDGSDAAGNQIRIRGKVSDEKAISKIYFLMNNRVLKVDGYEMILTPTNDSEKNLINFNFTVPPEDQENLVSVIAENIDDLIAQKAILVFAKSITPKTQIMTQEEPIQAVVKEIKPEEKKAEIVKEPAIKEKPAVTQTPPKKKRKISFLLILLVIGAFLAIQ